MEIIHLHRGAGKTEELLRHLKYDPDAVMVVADQRRRAYILRRLEFNGMAKAEAEKRVYTVDSWQRAGKHWLEKIRIVVDDVDAVLQHILGRAVKVATVTKEEGNDSTTNNRNGVSRVSRSCLYARCPDSPCSCPKHYE